MADDNSSIITEISTKASGEPLSLEGRTLDDRYLIERALTDDGADSGGIGLVYLASDLKLPGRRAVVKVLNASTRENEDVRRKFEHEKEALIKLRHPNIVDIQSIGFLDDGNPYVIMEYISGYSLRKLLTEEGRQPLDRVAHITESVANALGAAHDQKIFHRDIKPENIMLSPQSGGFDHVKLIDFGIARVEEAQLPPVTTIPGVMGTLRYMAPEQLMGSLVQTPAIDVYALAVVVHEMVTGETPYRGTATEIYEMQKSGPTRRPSDLRSDVTASVDTALVRGLAFDPAARPQNAREFGREIGTALRNARAQDPTAPTLPAPALTEVSSGQRSESPRVPTEEIDADSLANFRLPPQARRKSKAPLLAAAGVLVMALLGIPLGIAYWNSKPSDPPASTSTNAAALAALPGESRKLSYHLDVQKMLNGQPVGQSFRSTGEEVYQNGQKFRMSLTAPADGFLYVFAEGKNAKGAQTFSIIFPTPKTNNGTAAVTRDQLVETGFNTFGGTAAEEVLWAIWTEDQNPDLESARTSAFSNAGEVDSAGGSKIKEFIEKTPASKKEDVKADLEKTETTVKTQGDAFVHKIVLQHK